MVNRQKGAAPTQDADARRIRWLDENVTSFAAQARWHAQNDHPLADIRMDPVRDLLVVTRPVPGRDGSQA
jgi:hypothetical protein